MTTLTLPYPPSLNRLYRTVKGRMLLSSAGRAYKLECFCVAKQQNAKKLKGELIVKIDAYRPRKTGDLDNVLKGLLDSIQGVCYENDSQIVEIFARRFDDKKNPRIEIILSEKEV